MFYLLQSSQLFIASPRCSLSITVTRESSLDILGHVPTFIFKGLALLSNPLTAGEVCACVCVYPPLEGIQRILVALELELTSNVWNWALPVLGPKLRSSGRQGVLTNELCLQLHILFFEWTSIKFCKVRPRIDLPRHTLILIVKKQNSDFLLCTGILFNIVSISENSFF